MSFVRTLIADGDSTTRRRAIRLLMDLRDAEITSVCTTGPEAVAGIQRDAPNLVLLDAGLPQLDALGVLRTIGTRAMPYTVFVVPEEHPLVRALAAAQLPYLFRTYDAVRFHAALTSARAALSENAAQGEKLMRLLEEVDKNMMPDATTAQGQRRYLERVLIRQAGQIIFLKVGDIDWLEAAANYIRIHSGTDTYLIRDTMTAMEQKLPPESFVRVHRSTIVNVDRIARMYQWFSGDYMVVLKDGAELRLSRHYRARLEDRLIKNL